MEKLSKKFAINDKTTGKSLENFDSFIWTSMQVMKFEFGAQINVKTNDKNGKTFYEAKDVIFMTLIPKADRGSSLQFDYNKEITIAFTILELRVFCEALKNLGQSILPYYIGTKFYGQQPFGITGPTDPKNNYYQKFADSSKSDKVEDGANKTLQIKLHNGSVQINLSEKKGTINTSVQILLNDQVGGPNRAIALANDLLGKLDRFEQFFMEYKMEARRLTGIYLNNQKQQNGYTTYQPTTSQMIDNTGYMYPQNSTTEYNYQQLSGNEYNQQTIYPQQ